jgi:hypothetical protein
MYLDNKRKRRHKRREYMAKYRLSKLEKMNPEQRQHTLERIRNSKQDVH